MSILNNDLKEVDKIIENNTNLLQKAEIIIQYNIDNKCEPDELLDSLMILGGQKFARVLFFSIIKSTNDDVIFNEEDIEGVSEKLIQELTYFKAKFETKLSNLIALERNEHGWKSLEKNITYDVSNNTYLEFKIIKVNDEKVYIKDTISSSIGLIKEMIESIDNSYDVSKISEDELLNIRENYKELIKVSKSVKSKLKIE